jgi:TonB family protein
MIQRFALLSVLLHAGAAAALAITWHQPLTIAAPELHVALAGKSLPSAIGTENKGSADTVSRNTTISTTDVRNPPVLLSAPSIQAGMQAQSGQTQNSETESDTHLVNHLLAELRSAFDARFVYPPLARRHGWQGQVRVGLTVESDGHLSELRILSSSGYAILDRDALQTLTRIGVLPQTHTRLDGQSYRLQLPVVYRLIES